MSDFYFNEIEKYTILFLSLFKDLHVQRRDNNNVVVNSFRVPIYKENVAKRYVEEYSNLQTVGAKFPMIGITDAEITKNTEFNRSPLAMIKQNSAFYKNKMVIMKNPRPYIFTFKVSVRTAPDYDTDMMQLIKIFIDRFDDMIVKSIIVDQEFPLELKTAIIKKSGPDNESEFDNLINTHSDIVNTKTFTFELHGYIFRSKEIKKAITSTHVYNDDTIKIIDRLNSFNSKSMPLNDIIDTMNTSNFIKHIGGELKKGVNFYNVSDLLAEHGEFIDIYLNGEPIPFIYLYNNGEYYSGDYYVPEFRTLQKTGVVAFKLPEDYVNEKVSIKTVTIKSYNTPDTVFDMYDDFNVSGLYNFARSITKENEYMWNKYGVLHSETLSDTMFNTTTLTSKIALDRIKRTFTFTLKDYVHQEDNIIGGLQTDEGHKLIFIAKMDEYNKIIEVYEVNSTSETLIAVIQNVRDCDYLIVNINISNYINNNETFDIVCKFDSVVYGSEIEQVSFVMTDNTGKKDYCLLLLSGNNLYESVKAFYS